LSTDTLRFPDAGRGAPIFVLQNRSKDLIAERWQTGNNSKPYAELPGLFKRLGNEWAVYRFLVQDHGSLGGMAGRDALKRGLGPEVVAAAEGVERGDFT
jgi:hypothetical protein